MLETIIFGLLIVSALVFRIWQITSKCSGAEIKSKKNHLIYAGEPRGMTVHAVFSGALRQTCESCERPTKKNLFSRTTKENLKRNRRPILFIPDESYWISLMMKSKSSCCHEMMQFFKRKGFEIFTRCKIFLSSLSTSFNFRFFSPCDLIKSRWSESLRGDHDGCRLVGIKKWKRTSKFLRRIAHNPRRNDFFSQANKTRSEWNCCKVEKKVSFFYFYLFLLWLFVFTVFGHLSFFHTLFIRFCNGFG